jgi:endonuclease/exonuclease/phosphatase family metal-dependent hydrolase
MLHAAVRPLKFTLLCSAVGLFAAGCGQPPLEPRDPTPGVPHFSVATYNVLAEIHYDQPTVETIGATHADIICLQEVTNEWEAVIRARYSAEYPNMLFYPEGSGGIAVLSKLRLIDREFHTAPNGWHPAWSVLAETPAGWLDLLVVHLRSLYSGTGGVVEDYLNWGSDHIIEIKPLLASVPAQVTMTPPPRMIVGDFNEESNGDGVHYLESFGFTNVLPLFRPGQFTWRSPSLGNQFTEELDHILYDDAVLPLNAYALNRGNSDHIPVVAQFEASRAWPDFEPPAPKAPAP